MTAIQKSPLGVDQAVGILETLALLGADQHKTSKIVYYDTKIALEQDSPAWRTAHAWTSSVASTVSYDSGYSPETGCRKLRCLPSLVKRVYAVLEDQQNIPADLQTMRGRQELAEEAETGLMVLKAIRYRGMDEKMTLVDAALSTIKKIKKFYKEKYDELFEKTMKEMKSQSRQWQETREQQAEKDQELARLRKRVGELEQPIARQHDTNQYWVQVLAAKEEEYSRKLAEKDQLLASVTLTHTVDLEKASPMMILAMLRELTDVLAEKLTKL